MRIRTTLIFCLMILCLLAANAVPAYAVDSAAIEAKIGQTADYMQKTVVSPAYGSVGGEWLILGLERSGLQVQQSYFDAYYKSLLITLNQCGGVLHAKKYTEYSRVVLALTAMGKNPANVGGYNLLKPLADFKKTTYQGVNGSAFALLALDSGDYQIPVNTDALVQATRQMYVDDLLSRQLADGGFNLTGTVGDPDITAMVLQALANYRTQDKVKPAVETAVAFLSDSQQTDGGYKSGGTVNTESVSQVIITLCQLGIDPADSRFVKNGNTLLDNLAKYALENGGYCHLLSIQTANEMATEQAFCALVAYQRFVKQQNTFYDMSDVLKRTNALVFLWQKFLSDLKNSDSAKTRSLVHAE